ncbi:hypothetical protein OHB12_05370 [Nocardia sp. NBC_01730]|nr:hypothetical protein OHB12_05370 [Nocardia sp. NBC_01730]
MMVAFYQLFGLVFFIITRSQPPPRPERNLAEVAQWFDDNHYGLLYGFAVMFVFTGMTAPINALIAYSIRRMSVSRAYAYSYLIIYSLSAIPGSMLLCLVLTVGAMRPDRDPEALRWIYDFAFLSYVGTMGVFLIGSFVWMVAILIDKNNVFPKWFAYLNLCNALTEVVVSPAWIFHRGVFAWNGLISWWIGMAVFGIYTAACITLLRKMILREDFGTGPLPDLPPSKQSSAPASLEVAR